MTHRVLVVDDDRSMVKTLAEILRMQGWEVETAYEGGAAVRAVEAQPFDIVLMDFKMPGMDGVDAFKAMKAARPGVKVMLMTAFAAQERIVEAEEEGVVRVWSKPVDIRSLLAFLDAAVRHPSPVLLIDSDRAFLKTLSEVLQLRGFETAMAASLEDAVRLIDEKRPVAILLHMHLGTTSARAAVRVLHEARPDLPLILYSGRPGAEREIDGDVPAEWVHSYLAKPFPIEQVAGVLSEVVNG